MYGYFEVATAHDIMTRENYKTFIQRLFDTLLVKLGYIIKQRLDRKSGSCFSEMMITDQVFVKSLYNAPVLQANQSAQTVLHNTDRQNIIKNMFDFPNNAEAKRINEEFRSLLFTLFVLLHSIQETRMFLNLAINTYASISVMDEIWKRFDDANRAYLKDRMLNRALLPTSWFETIVCFFAPRKSNGELKIPFTDIARYVSYCYEINQIRNKLITVENNSINSINNETYYDYVDYIFGPHINDGASLDCSEDVMKNRFHSKNMDKWAGRDQLDDEHMELLGQANIRKKIK